MALSGLAPRTFYQHQPDTDRAADCYRDPVSNQVGPALPIHETGFQPSSANLHGDTELTDVIRALRSESDLDVANLRRSGPRLLGTLNGFSNEVWQEIGKSSKLAVRHGVVVSDIDQWHVTSLA